MGELINLNRFRKAQVRAGAEQQAAANRARHGRPKTERRRGEHEAEKVEKDLDGKRID